MGWWWAELSGCLGPDGDAADVVHSQVRDDEILGTRVDLTIVDGGVRFEREAARASAGTGPSPGP